MTTPHPTKSAPAPSVTYTELPDFDTVEQRIYAGCRRFISADMLEPIHGLIREAIDADRASRGQAPASAAVAVPVKWWNGCDKTVPAALRYLADNERPSGGEARFNCAHLYQLAGEIERMARLPLYTAPVPAAQGAGHA